MPDEKIEFQLVGCGLGYRLPLVIGARKNLENDGSVEYPI